MKKNKHIQAFTLLEILLVVAAIAILALIVIVAINPVRQLTQFRDSQRESHLYQTQSALVQYLIDNGTYPSGLTDTPVEICATGEETTEHEIGCEGLLDLSPLVPTYIASIPKDPLSTQLSGQGSGYFVLTGEAGRLCLEAPNAETKAVGDDCGASGLIGGGTGGNEPDALVIDVETTGSGQWVMIPLKTNVDVTIDWGDGSEPQDFNNDDPTHQYNVAGEYTVVVTGSAEVLGNTDFATSLESDWRFRVRGIQSWGDLGFKSFHALFFAVNEHFEVPNNIPDSVTDLGFMFSANNFNEDISGWDTQNVESMFHMFGGANSFNQNIGGWNTSKVTEMVAMFDNAHAFNQDLSGWCVTLITSEPGGFAAATDSWTLPKPVWGTCP